MLLDTESSEILDKEDLIEYKDKMPVFELLKPGTSNLFMNTPPSPTGSPTLERVNVTKGIRRKQSIALGFQRTNFSPKEIFKSVNF